MISIDLKRNTWTLSKTSSRIILSLILLKFYCLFFFLKNLKNRFQEMFGSFTRPSMKRGNSNIFFPFFFFNFCCYCNKNSLKITENVFNKKEILKQ